MKEKTIAIIITLIVYTFCDSRFCKIYNLAYMSVKEKAQELIDKFSNVPLLDSYEAKQCALIAVDEMILALPFTDTNYSLNEYAIHLQKYLEQVKQEIEKL